MRSKGVGLSGEVSFESLRHRHHPYPHPLMHQPGPLPPTTVTESDWSPCSTPPTRSQPARRAPLPPSLRKLAAAKLANEKPGQTLQATALVHEAFLRLVATPLPGEPGAGQPQWDSRGHFFAAAGQAMRRILVENARRKKRLKQGGELARQELVDIPIELPDVHEDLLALDGALDRLKSIDPQAVELIHLRYFAGLSLAEAAKTLRIPSRTADRVWAYARAWLHREIAGPESQRQEK